MAAQSRISTWIGWIIAGLIGLLMTFSGVMKLLNPPGMAEEVSKLGYPDGVMLYIGLVELSCVVFYLVPRTAVLGAVLLTGYLGGAIATHVRLSENFAGAAVVGVLVWLALFLRDPRIRAVLPWRSA